MKIIQAFLCLNHHWYLSSPSLSQTYMPEMQQDFSAILQPCWTYLFQICSQSSSLDLDPSSIYIKTLFLDSTSLDFVHVSVSEAEKIQAIESNVITRHNL